MGKLDLHNLLKWLAIGLSFAAASLGLARLPYPGEAVQAAPAFGIMLALAAGLVYLAWRSIASQSPPAWLLSAAIIALVLRIGVGVFWTLALPEWGYDQPVQNAGYIMADAFDRDGAAWKLAQSELPLSAAFQGYDASDQYGGLLFLSALVYRYLGIDQHRPLLMIVLASAFSSLVVFYTWAFARRVWGQSAARLAAWIIVFYPEAVLLGSSQMREAFMVTLAAWAFFALLLAKERFHWKSALFLVFPVLLSLPLSSPFFILLVTGLAFTAIALDDWKLLRKRWFWWGAAGMVLLLLSLSVLDVLDIRRLWPFQAARWQAFYSQSASGWIQRTFERLPENMLWVQIPFLVLYGVFRPLLPAAFFDGIPLLRVVAVWRALGWTMLLAVLFYATFLAFRDRRKEKFTLALLFLTWGIILAASLRGGGDQWDNPRYRSAFAALQVALAAFALLRRKEVRDPWFHRAVVGTSVMVLWFVPWYLRRYTSFDWPLVALHQTIGFALLNGALYLLWDWMRMNREKLSPAPSAISQEAARPPENT